MSEQEPIDPAVDVKAADVQAVVADGELTDAELSQVAGGQEATITQDVTVNKAKTADKAFNAMDAYVRG